MAERILMPISTKFISPVYTKIYLSELFDERDIKFHLVNQNNTHIIGCYLISMRFDHEDQKWYLFNFPSINHNDMIKGIDVDEYAHLKIVGVDEL